MWTRGRIAGLIEVGAGFHPDLTGRENIYLNGAILGMSEAEIARKFDAIVDFSEMEQFLDSDVRHYSSGMFMRLAFSVAIHTDCDIFLMDEMLAVGDQPFKRKCMRASRTEEDGPHDGVRQSQPQAGPQSVREGHRAREGQGRVRRHGQGGRQYLHYSLEEDTDED